MRFSIRQSFLIQHWRSWTKVNELYYSETALYSSWCDSRISISWLLYLKEYIQPARRSENWEQSSYIYMCIIKAQTVCILWRMTFVLFIKKMKDSKHRHPITFYYSCGKNYFYQLFCGIKTASGNLLSIQREIWNCYIYMCFIDKTFC